MCAPIVTLTVTIYHPSRVGGWSAKCTGPLDATGVVKNSRDAVKKRIAVTRVAKPITAQGGRRKHTHGNGVAKGFRWNTTMKHTTQCTMTYARLRLGSMIPV